MKLVWVITISFEALLADKAFEADWLLKDIGARMATAVIPPNAKRIVQRDFDTETYKWRHMVENYYAKIKEFRVIATRYDKTESSYTASLYLATALIVSRSMSTGPRNIKTDIQKK